MTETMPDRAPTAFERRIARNNANHARRRKLGLDSLPMAAKYPAQDLLRHADEQNWDTEQIEKTLGAMAEVIHQLKDQIGHLMVDKTNAVHAATERALDCTEHGKVIADLEKRVHAVSEDSERKDRGRTAALGLLHAINETLSVMKDRKALGQPLPSGEEFVKALTKAAKKTSAAHDRAVKR